MRYWATVFLGAAALMVFVPWVAYGETKNVRVATGYVFMAWVLALFGWWDGVRKFVASPLRAWHKPKEPPVRHDPDPTPERLERQVYRQVYQLLTQLAADHERERLYGPDRGE